MDNQIPEDPYRILARERSHEDARQTVATNRMLVQSLVIINGGAAIAVLAYIKDVGLNRFAVCGETNFDV